MTFQALNDPLVSIIIPCYNAEKYVGEAIESALAQTYPNKEVIVIDDGSTDGSLQVIKSFGDRIRWETGPNRGGSAARNRGIELARGELIQFLDADDLLHPKKLEKQVSFHLENKADWSICLGDVIPPDDVCAPTYRRLYKGEDPVVFTLLGGLQTAASIHFRSNLIRVGGFDQALPCAQERDLHIRLACLDLKLVQLPEILFTVRRVRNSVSADWVRVFLQHERIALRAWQVLKERGTLTDVRAEALAAFLAHDARALLRAGHRDVARRYFKLAREIHPTGGDRLVYTPGARWLKAILGTTGLEWLSALRRGMRGRIRLRFLIGKWV